MKNQRQNQIEPSTKDFSFVKKLEEADALFRSFGNSEGFPYGTLTTNKDFGYLKDCSVYYLKVHNSNTYKTFEQFEYEDLTYSAMGGNTYDSNPYGVKINRNDILRAHTKYGGK